MPYRRLPNTDSARLKALKTALEKGENIPPKDKPFSQSSLQNLTVGLPQLESLINLQKEAYKQQTTRSVAYNYLYKKARNYVSHFIQVLNLAIIRGDLKKTARDFFGLEMETKKLPAFKTEKELIKWGKIILEGEQERILSGGNPMTNPTIGVVKVHYDNFISAYRQQKNLQEQYMRATQQVADYREKADRVILQLWNEIEASFEPNSEVLKRNLCREYGVVYFFRRNELIPDNENVSEEYRKKRVVNKDLKEEQPIAENNSEESVIDEIEIVDNQSIIDESDNLVEDNVGEGAFQYDDELEEERLEENESLTFQKEEEYEEEEEQEELASFQYSLF